MYIEYTFSYVYSPMHSSLTLQKIATLFLIELLLHPS